MTENEKTPPGHGQDTGISPRPGVDETSAAKPGNGSPQLSGARPAGILQSSTTMAFATLVSRITGFARAALLTALLGVQGAVAYDAFSVANTVPNQIYLLVAGGFLNAVIVPQIVRAARNPRGAAEFLNVLLTFTIIFTGCCTVAAVAAAPLVPAIMSEFPPGSAASNLCVAFAIWCLPQIFGYTLYTLLGQVLNAQGKFGSYMWAPVLNNIIAIAGISLLLVWIGPFSRAPHAPESWTPGQIALLGGTATLGVLAQALILLRPLLKSGFRYRPRWALRGLGLRSAGRVVLWTLASVLVSQLGIIAISRVSTGAAAAGAGGRGAYDNAFLLFMLPHALVTVSIVTALFTTMSQAAAAAQVSRVRSLTSVGLRLTGAFTIFATLAGMVFAPLVISIGFAFNSPADSAAISYVLMAMLLGLVPFSAHYLLQRVFYSFEDARTPFLIQLPIVAIITLGSLSAGRFLAPELVVIGIGVSMSMSYFVGAVISGLVLRRRLNARGGEVLWTYGRFLFAAIISAALAYNCRGWLEASLSDGILQRIVILLASGAAMAATYLILAHWLGVREIEEMRTVVLRKASPSRRRNRE